MDAYMDYLPDDEEHEEGRQRAEAIRDFAEDVLGRKDARNWSDLECGQVMDLFEDVLKKEFD